MWAIEFIEAYVVSLKEEGKLMSVTRSALRETARAGLEGWQIPTLGDLHDQEDIEKIYENILRKHDIPILEDVEEEP